MLSFDIAQIAAAIFALGYVFCIKDMFWGEAQPNRVTWLIWAPLGTVMFLAFRGDEANASALALPLVAAIGPVLIFIGSLFKGEAKWTKLEIACAILAAISLFVLVVYRSNEWAMLFAIIADAAGFAPTYPKVVKDPRSESQACWTLWAVGAVINLIALPEFHFASGLYSCWFVFVTLLMTYHTNRRPTKSLLIAVR